MENAPNANEKIILAVSFLAVLVTMYSYKDSLNQLKVIASFSMFDLLVYMSIALFTSIYLSALSNLRNSYKILENSKLLKACEKIADFLYLTAVVVLPTTFVGGYIILNLLLGLNHIVSYLIPNNIFQNTHFIDSFSLVFSFAAGLSIVLLLELLQKRTRRIRLQRTLHEFMQISKQVSGTIQSLHEILRTLEVQREQRK